MRMDAGTCLEEKKKMNQQVKQTIQHEEINPEESSERRKTKKISSQNETIPTKPDILKQL